VNCELWHRCIILLSLIQGIDIAPTCRLVILKYSDATCIIDINEKVRLWLVYLYLMLCFQSWRSFLDGSDNKLLIVGQDNCEWQNSMSLCQCVYSCVWECPFSILECWTDTEGCREHLYFLGVQSIESKFRLFSIYLGQSVDYFELTLLYRYCWWTFENFILFYHGFSLY